MVVASSGGTAREGSGVRWLERSDGVGLEWNPIPQGVTDPDYTEPKKLSGGSLTTSPTDGKVADYGVIGSVDYSIAHSLPDPTISSFHSG